MIMKQKKWKKKCSQNRRKFSMSTDSSVNFKKVIKSFSFAFQGIFHALINERNLKIHSVVTVLVIAMGFIFSISRTEWIFILFAIAGVVSLELVNTAIERTVDLVTKDIHLLAKQAKDIAAGAVLVYTIVAVIIGMIIFIPKILGLLS
jgi:undecaprenol kinase